MSRTTKVVETSAGTVYKQVVASDGRTMHFRDGTPVKQQSFAAAASNTKPVQVLKRGNLGGIDSIDDVTELGQEYAATLTRDVRQYPRGSAERKQAADINRWLGFKSAAGTPDDPIEAAKQYEEMKDRLAEAVDEREEREIKRDYNIGGS